ncbi:MAG: hypothetical protein FWG73_08180 [Planctomycetaceae bacterium]|nr:hypothetical protein [Planctomycetaceae bacterium]
MTSFPSIFGSFVQSVAGSTRAAGNASPVIFGARLAPMTAAIGNIRDAFVPSVPAARNTYLPPSKIQQNITKPNPNSQASLLHDVRNIYLQVSKIQQDRLQQNTQQQYQASHATNVHSVAVPSISCMKELLQGGTTSYIWQHDSRKLSANHILGVTQDALHATSGRGDTAIPELGGMILRDLDGNIIQPGEYGRPFDPHTALEGHDILDRLFPSLYRGEVPKRAVDDYGYWFVPPSGALKFEAGQDGIATLMYSEIHGHILTAEDYSGLDGLTLEERDVFYAEVQKIFDQNGIARNARGEVFQLHAAHPPDLPKPTVGCDGLPLPPDFVWTPFPGGWSWDGLSSVADQAAYQNVRQELIDNSTLHALFEKAEGVRNKTIADDTLAQQYSIRVTDNDGNRLANDRIIVEAKNGNQVEMSVEQFSQMSRLEITALLW